MSMNNWGNYTQSRIEKIAGHIVFISYQTPVAVILDNGAVVRTKARFSRTTGKQISKFFNQYNVNRDGVKEVTKDLFMNLLKEVGYNSGLGMLNSPYIQ